MTETIDRYPPQSVEIEMALLGSIMIDEPGTVIEIVQEILKPEFFYNTSNKLTYTAMLSLYNKNDRIDLMTVTEALKSVGKLEEVGGSFYLTECIGQVTSAANAEFHAKIIKEKAVLRGIITISAELANNAYAARTGADELLSDAYDQLINLQSDVVYTSDMISFSSGLIDVKKDLKRRYEKNVDIMGLSTGFDHFDELTGGLQETDFAVWAGRPRMGKTASALSVALHNARKGIPVGIFSLEMSIEKLIYRMIANEYGINSYNFKNPRKYLKSSEYAELIENIDNLNYPIYFNRIGKLTGKNLRIRIKSAIRKNGIKLAIIDYLQLMIDSDDRRKEYDQISEISRTCKQVNLDSKIPLIAISQLSRDPEKPENAKHGFRPDMSHLRASGQIEQDADIIVLWYKPYEYADRLMNLGQIKKPEYKTWKGLPDSTPFEYEKNKITEMIIAKNRDGDTGKDRYWFDQGCMRYWIAEPWAKDHTQETVNGKEAASGDYGDDELPF